MTPGERDPMRVGILTVSDGCYHGTREDRSGALIEEWCVERSHDVLDRRTVPDETSAIVPTLLEWCDDRGAHLVVTTGGTGFGPRDVTPEATRSVMEREAPGVADVIRRAGEAKTPHAVLSRGLVAIRGNSVIVNLPGSPGGVKDGLRVLDRIVPHAVRLVRDEETTHDHAAGER